VEFLFRVYPCYAEQLRVDVCSDSSMSVFEPELTNNNAMTVFINHKM
jgi:hypothetical protein